MKYIIIFSCLLVLVNCNCGCLKCNPHLKVISHENSPVTVIVRGDKNVPHPPQKHTCPLVKKYYESLGYSPTSPFGLNIQGGHNIEVEIPIDISPLQTDHHQQLVAVADRIILPEHSEQHRRYKRSSRSASKKKNEEGFRNGKVLRYDYYVVPKGNSSNKSLLEKIQFLKPEATLRLRGQINDTTFSDDVLNQFKTDISVIKEKDPRFWFLFQNLRQIDMSLLFDNEPSTIVIWTTPEEPEPLREMQSLFRLRPKHVLHNINKSLELEETTSEEFDQLDLLQQNQIYEFCPEVDFCNGPKSIRRSALQDHFDFEEGTSIPSVPKYGRFVRDVSKTQNRFRPFLSTIYERTNFPWQEEYQKLIKKRGNLHPMIRQKQLSPLSIKSTEELNERYHKPLNSLQPLKVFNDFENKVNEIKKRLATITSYGNELQGNLTKSLSLPSVKDNNVSENITAKVNSTSEILKERLAKMREDIMKKLESKRIGKDVVDQEIRNKRDTYLEADTPFFRIKDVGSLLGFKSGDSEEEDSYNFQQKKEENLEQSLMKPFNAEHIVPHNPIFYLLNFPMRCLDHLNKMKNQLSPVLHAFPLMLQKSRKYFKDMSKDAKKDVLHFGSNIVGSFTRLSPLKNPWDAVTPTKRRNKREVNNFGRNENSSPLSVMKVRDNVNKTVLLRQILGKTLLSVNVANNNAVEGLNGVEDFGKTMNKVSHSEKESKSKSSVKLGGYEPLYELVNKHYDPYDELEQSDKDNETFGARNKRAIFKLVDEDEVEQYLKEKFSHLDDSASFNNKYDFKQTEPNILRSTRVKNEASDSSSSKSKIVLEKIVPKIIIDDNGRPFAEIDGLRRPLFETRKRTLLRSPLVGSTQAQKAPSNSLSSIIEKARRYPIDGNEDSQKYSSDSNIHVQTIKNRLSQILDYIERLLHWDFEEDVHIYEDLLELQNRKNAIVRNWKTLLVQSKHNKINEKIVILKSLKKIQDLKDSCTFHIIEKLEQGHTFNTKIFIKFLVMLQKLHCLIVKIAEEFSDNLHIGKFDVEKEIEFVDYLQNIEFFYCQNHDEIREKLQEERDIELGKQISLLEDLKECLALAQGDKKYEKMIFDEAKLLWEFKNIEKLQQQSLQEMDKKLNSGLKIRKELKILFDLQKQYDHCEEKHTQLVQEILKDVGKKTKKYRFQNGKIEELNMVGAARFGIKKPTNIKNRKPLFNIKPKSSIMFHKNVGPLKKNLSFWPTFRK